jgi:AraC-like DNA-binding protein
MPLIRWFDGSSLSVCDWYCAGDVLGTGAEEHAGAYEVSIGRTGSHALRTAGGETIVEPTQLLCVNAGESFRPVRRARGLDRRTRITLRPDGLRDLATGLGADAPRFPVRTVPLTARIALAHHELLQHVQARMRDELAIQALALEVAAHALSASVRRPAARLSPGTRNAVLAAQELLAHRYAEPLTLDSIAAHVGLSPWHLSRSFRAYTGLGVHRYRARLRLLAALDRVRGTRRPQIARIALELGYSSHSHLTREFRAFFGAVPSRLQRS